MYTHTHVRTYVCVCVYIYIYIYIYILRCNPTRVMASSFLRFVDHTQRRTTVGRTPLDEGSARRRDLYLTTHNTHNRQTSMPRWDSNPRSSRRAAADLRLRPRGHWDRLYVHIHIYIFIYIYIYIFIYIYICLHTYIRT